MLIKICCFILLHEKFLQFNWLRAEVFQLNLKYLHVKITVSMVTKITKEIQKTMAERFPDFQVEEIQENRTEAKFRKPNHEEKYDNLAECLDQLGRKQQF